MASGITGCGLGLATVKRRGGAKSCFDAVVNVWSEGHEFRVARSRILQEIWVADFAWVSERKVRLLS